MFSSALDISTSALVAQRTRLDAIAANIANISTTHNEDGERVPYQPRHVVFTTDDAIATRDGASGVKVDRIVTENNEPIWKFQPNHPESNEQGMVAYPNINLTTEFTDALAATRAYEANIGVMEVTKSLGQQTLRILA
jgi:flagellar basal-body rod protein FlgC